MTDDMTDDNDWCSAISTVTDRPCVPLPDQQRSEHNNACSAHVSAVAETTYCHAGVSNTTQHTTHNTQRQCNDNTTNDNFYSTQHSQTIHCFTFTILINRVPALSMQPVKTVSVNGWLSTNKMFLVADCCTLHFIITFYTLALTVTCFNCENSDQTLVELIKHVGVKN